VRCEEVSPRYDAVGPGQTLFEFVRYWSRRSNTDASRATEQNGRYVLVTEVIWGLSKRGRVTINSVAREIGIDQSGASRLVKDAVQAGYLSMNPSPRDARQRMVAVTTAGEQLLVNAHRWQEEVFERLTSDWKIEERDAFHHAMLRMLERSHES